MPCNGNNHGPNCSCGWGGVFHGLGLIDGRHHWTRRESYTNPNAKCPLCNAQVYFYQSPYGGKVYFDNIGPPWPKHPCLEKQGTNSIPARSSENNQRHQSSIDQSLFKLEPGWWPMLCSSIQTLPENDNVVIFSIGDGQDKKQVYSLIPRARVDESCPIMIKRSADRSHYEISTLNTSRPIISEIRFRAFYSVKDLMKYEFPKQMTRITLANASLSKPTEWMQDPLPRALKLSGEAQRVPKPMITFDQIKDVAKNKLLARELHKKLAVKNEKKRV